MADFWQILGEAFRLILTGDRTVYQTTLLSLLVSGTATLLAFLWGVPIAALIALKSFRGKLLIKSMFNALVGIPTVALGLILYMLLSRSGPLGFLGLLYTPTAIIIGEAVLVTPLIISLASSAIEAVDPEIISLAKTLGASESQASTAVLREAANGLMVAGIMGFNRAISELGVALMVGGNMVLTTRIAAQINYDIALSLSLTIILLLVVFAANILAYIIRRRKA
ncbi:MAG: ABC transporter permease [Candidatus Bathyarchaeota archaeon]|nr:ABC transporter permease [Candidatus Bathyarchaeota archaeon]MCX8177098.1 ABC transporter permease [Candidatus Bathyarchaeota archaeon]MDW8193731.1 ABC transporter permease [Nitrososphaerota archaeon]